MACCCRNGSATLRAALDSALAQVHADLEILLIDDASTDDSMRVMREYEMRDERVRAIHLDTRHGLAGAQNVALQQAAGEFLAFIDADDLWRPSKIALQLERMARDVAVVGCYSAVIDDRGALRGWRLGSEVRHWPDGLLKGDPVSGGSVALLRVDALRAAGGFDESLVRRPDWDMWLRLSRRHRLLTVPQVLVGYRRGTGGLSSEYRQMVVEGRSIISKLGGLDAGIGDGELAAVLAEDLAGIAGLAAIDGAYDEARQLYRDAAQLARAVVASPGRRYLRAALATGAAGHKLFVEGVAHLMAPRWVGGRVGAPFLG